ncbi:sugar dehydrogenase complex small subunit [Gluconobacter cerinus]|uniref:sugar dehydrogenase complex small subunit n=1 Tax=Gluconobacter cerinus TaxID=38307 RepID=UPI001B8BD47E|nr:sugar dehydrogenase complex small subunit [Gluconobacter cerinus]MBS1026278.1 sorbitol dehydrogenase family protein [Gluconobacter cerinus]MBS1045031.1 sorbitol dehydrogenase family protein [Gluconobacter cerinus]
MEKLPDPNPVPVFLSRRRLLALSGACITAAAIGTVKKGSAQEIVASNRNGVSDFMQLSTFATGHKNLDLAIGSALLLAFEAQAHDFSARVAALRERIAKNGYQDVEALDEGLNGDPLHTTLLQIIRGWYAGVIEGGTNAKVYAFEKALMYQSSRDVVVIPTYAHNGPNYWVAEPGSVDVMPEF